MRLIITIVLTLAMFSLPGLAEVEIVDSAIKTADAVHFPYIAEITGTRLNLRSGPGTNYYSCGKISQPARVVVVAKKFSWSRILPPEGSFSWIFKQYVQIDPADSRIGTITANNVRVYVGAEDRDPMRSDSVQIELKAGQKVQVIDASSGDYYKIKPPEGACLWISSEYAKFIRALAPDELELTIPKAEPVKLDVAVAEAVITPEPAMPVVNLTAAGRSLERYYDLVRNFEDEKAKPLSQQNYVQIETELNKLTADPNNGEAGSYAKYLLKQISRCKLAQLSATALQSHQTELQKALAEIEKEHKAKKESFRLLGQYSVLGILKPSLVYETQVVNKRFLVVDANGRPLCYAEPTGEAVAIDFEDFFQQQIGLTGDIIKDSQSNLALVKFEKIEKIQEK